MRFLVAEDRLPGAHQRAQRQGIGAGAGRDEETRRPRVSKTSASSLLGAPGEVVGAIGRRVRRGSRRRSPRGSAGATPAPLSLAKFIGSSPVAPARRSRALLAAGRAAWQVRGSRRGEKNPVPHSLRRLCARPISVMFQRNRTADADHSDRLVSFAAQEAAQSLGEGAEKCAAWRIDDGGRNGQMDEKNPPPEAPRSVLCDRNVLTYSD